MLTMLVANLRETRTNTQTAELVRKHKAPTVLLRTKWVCVFVGVAVSLRALTAKISRVLFVRVLKKLRTESNWKRYTEGEGGRQAVCHFNEHFSLPAKSTEFLPLWLSEESTLSLRLVRAAKIVRWCVTASFVVFVFYHHLRCCCCCSSSLRCSCFYHDRCVSWLVCVCWSAGGGCGCCWRSAI